MFDTNSNANLALLQIGSMTIGSGLPSPASILFNWPIRGLLPQIGRAQILFNNDDDHYDTIIKRQQNTYQNINSCKDCIIIAAGYTVAELIEDGGPQMHSTMLGHGSQYQNNISHRIHIMMMGISSQEHHTMLSRHQYPQENTCKVNCTKRVNHRKALTLIS